MSPAAPLPSQLPAPEGGRVSLERERLQGHRDSFVKEPFKSCFAPFAVASLCSQLWEDLVLLKSPTRTCQTLHSFLIFLPDAASGTLNIGLEGRTPEPRDAAVPPPGPPWDGAAGQGPAGTGDSHHSALRGAQGMAGGAWRGLWAGGFTCTWSPSSSLSPELSLHLGSSEHPS